MCYILAPACSAFISLYISMQYSVTLYSAAAAVLHPLLQLSLHLSLSLSWVALRKATKRLHTIDQVHD